MNRRSWMIAVATTSIIVTVARGGHELPVYPSYYPHEIELASVAPERAAGLLRVGEIQAFVGRAPRGLDAPPDSIGSVESLGSFVIVRVNPSAPLARDGQALCAAMDAVVRDLAGKSGDLIVHPYPVTPFHGDYLHHVDRAETARAHIFGGRAEPSSVRDLKVKAAGAVARSLVRREWLAQDSDWDVEVAEVGAAALVADASIAINGWLGPAWMKAGYFHAFLLLNGQGDDEDRRRHIETQLVRLQTSDYEGAVERINLERSLVATLAGGCRTRVAGYTVRREHFNTAFASGIENISFDSITGLNSPMFIRTVKLKSFPWNGWLALGIDRPPSAAWNPIAGFTDEFGRMMWSAVGDPALLPSPYESAWMLNRISEIQSSAQQ